MYVKWNMMGKSYKDALFLSFDRTKPSPVSTVLHHHFEAAVPRGSGTRF